MASNKKKEIRKEFEAYAKKNSDADALEKKNSTTKGDKAKIVLSAVETTKLLVRAPNKMIARQLHADLSAKFLAISNDANTSKGLKWLQWYEALNFVFYQPLYALIRGPVVIVDATIPLLYADMVVPDDSVRSVDLKLSIKYQRIKDVGILDEMSACIYSLKAIAFEKTGVDLNVIPNTVTDVWNMSGMPMMTMRAPLDPNFTAVPLI